MATTIAIRFPLGHYHATPWDRSVNEGAAEWPPSPWRLLRALVSTWYTRWPELPATVLDGLLDALGDAPSYQVPHAWPGHTRHYLPDLGHKKGEQGATDLTLDPFLSVPRDEDLLVRWEADLDGEQRAVLAKLAGLVPYLGRAEAVCDAQLIEDDTAPDDSWWQPGAEGARSTRLLAPARPVSRPALEMSTVEVRRSRRLMPPGTVWVSYCAAAEEPEPQPPLPRPEPMTAIRFAVVGRAPVRRENAVLLADAMHSRAATLLRRAGRTDGPTGGILGSKGATTDHHHAHWIPLWGDSPDEQFVQAMVVWVPQGLDAEDVGALVGLRDVDGRRGRRDDDDGYEVRGLPPVELLLQGAGPVGQVAPELCGPARRWRSRTPYLPVRHWHRKRESLDEYLSADVCAELAYRDLRSATVAIADPADGLPDRWARGFRRYRMSEHLGKSRPGLGLRLEFAGEVAGPLLLGQLSHFGYGIFVPDPR